MKIYIAYINIYIYIYMSYYIGMIIVAMDKLLETFLKNAIDGI
jgi:hypothetical protein